MMEHAAPIFNLVFSTPEAATAFALAVPGLIGKPIDAAAAQLNLDALRAAKKPDDIEQKRTDAQAANERAKATAARIESTLDPISVEILLVQHRLSGGGVSTASQARIAREIGCSKPTIQVRIDDGRLDEWIIVRRRPGYRVSNETHFTEGTIEALALIAKRRRNESRAENRSRKAVEKLTISVSKMPRAKPNNPVTSLLINNTHEHTTPRTREEDEQVKRDVVVMDINNKNDEGRETPVITASLPESKPSTPLPRGKGCTVFTGSETPSEPVKPEVSWPPTPQETMVSILVDAGVSAAFAACLVREFSLDRIGRNLALPGVADADSPGAWLVAAIRGDWAKNTPPKRPRRGTMAEPIAGMERGAIVRKVVVEGYHLPKSDSCGELAEKAPQVAGVVPIEACSPGSQPAPEPPKAAPIDAAEALKCAREEIDRREREASAREIERMRREKAIMAEKDRIIAAAGGFKRGRFGPKIAPKPASPPPFAGNPARHGPTTLAAIMGDAKNLARGG